MEENLASLRRSSSSLAPPDAVSMGPTRTRVSPRLRSLAAKPSISSSTWTMVCSAAETTVAFDPERVAALPPAEGWQYVQRGREVYVWRPEGLQSDRRTERTWAQLLGTAGTNRNWNTVRTLVELTR